MGSYPKHPAAAGNKVFIPTPTAVLRGWEWGEARTGLPTPSHIPALPFQAVATSVCFLRGNPGAGSRGGRPEESG